MSHVLTLLALSLLGVAPGGTDAKPDAPWAMTLRDAMRVGFDNCEFAHLKDGDGGADGKGLLIAPTDAERPVEAFRAEAMDLALAVERQYWQVGQKNAALNATVVALGMAQQTLKRENAKIEIGRGNPDAVDEAQKRVDAYHRDVAAALRDLVASEHQLKAVLGLPPEGRRIAPTSTPLEAELLLDWKTCLAEMHAHEPEADGGQGRPAEPDDQVRDNVKKTHELARYFLEVSANFKQFRTAAAQVSEALNRLEVLRTDYEQGEAAADVYLDAVDRWTEATSQEADFKARYNTSVASVERAKGTLLDHDQIFPLVARPAHKGVIRPAHLRDDQTVQASHEVPSAAPATPASKTFSFRLTFGSGPHPAELSGSFTVTP